MRSVLMKNVLMKSWIPRNSYMGVIKLFIHTLHHPSEELCRAQW